jgi:hypothetical protein
MYSNVPMAAGSRGLRLPEGVIEAVVSETAALDDKLLVGLVKEDIEPWDEVIWEEELSPLDEKDDNPWDDELDTVDDTLGIEGVEDDKPWVVLLLEGETTKVEVEVIMELLLQDNSVELKLWLLNKDNWLDTEPEVVWLVDVDKLGVVAAGANEELLVVLVVVVLACGEAVLWKGELDMLEDMDDNTVSASWENELDTTDEDDRLCDEVTCEDETDLVKGWDVEDELDWREEVVRLREEEVLGLIDEDVRTLEEEEELAWIDEEVAKLEEEELDLIEEVEVMLEEVVVLWAAAPVNKTSTYPPTSLQNVRYEAEIPIVDGPKNKLIVMEAADANWELTLGNDEAV